MTSMPNIAAATDPTPSPVAQPDLFGTVFVRAPRDVSTGQATGRRISKPIRW